MSGGHFTEFQHVRDDGWDINGVRVHPELIASGGLSVFGEEIGRFMREYLRGGTAHWKTLTSDEYQSECSRYRIKLISKVNIDLRGQLQYPSIKGGGDGYRICKQVAGEEP